MQGVARVYRRTMPGGHDADFEISAAVVLRWQGASSRRAHVNADQLR